MRNGIGIEDGNGSRVVSSQGVRTPHVEVPEEREGDHWFNPLRGPRTPRARALVQEVTERLQQYERSYAWRQRKRRPADQVVFEATVSAVVCDLARHYLFHGPESALAYSRSNRQLCQASRYKPLALNKTLPTIVDRLASGRARYLTATLGRRQEIGDSASSTMMAGDRLILSIQSHGVRPDDFMLTQDHEAIVLKRPKQGFWDQGARAEYGDTTTTVQYRQEIRAINHWLMGADIELDAWPEGLGGRVDPTDRSLRRVFTMGRFDHGGRAFGGFWQKLNKYERRCWIKIDGEPVVNLDYSQMAVRMLYGLSGVEPAFEDGYRVPLYEKNRDGVKTVFNSLLFMKKPPVRMPRGVGELFGPGARIKEVIGALEVFHRPIRGQFYTGVGHRLQFTESQIIITALLRLRELGVVALPVHDALVAKASEKDLVKEVMEQAFSHHAGIQGVVMEE